RDGGRHARAECGSEHVSLEGAQGADSSRGAADALLSAGASIFFSLGASRSRATLASVHAIATSGLTKHYGPRPLSLPFIRPAPPIRALASLDIAVREGEIFGFLGPNGA